ncbi:MAG: transcriptional regulator NrdR [bacterium]
MRCPICGHVDSKVLDSRANNNARFVRRRRECLSCGRRFTTKEYVEETPLFVIKGNGSREVFHRDKVIKGVQLACNKRPISSDEIDNLVDKVEGRLRDKNRSEVEAMQIGEELMKELRELDEVAYVRFASVYRKFQDKEQFINELRGLEHR